MVFQHDYPYQIGEDFAGPGIDEGHTVVQVRQIATIACGHSHYEHVVNDGRNVVLAIRSNGPDHVITSPDLSRVRTWSHSPVAEVRGRLDGGKWFQLVLSTAGV